MAIVKRDSITEAQIRDDINVWLRAQPEGSVWRDFFPGGVGQTLVELISGVSAQQSHQARAARRESNLLTARLPTSVRALAYTFGYPINRRRAARLRLTLSNSSASAVRLLRGTPVAAVDGAPVSVIAADVSVPASGSAMVDCVLGDWVTTVMGEVDDQVPFYELQLEPTRPRRSPQEALESVDILDVDNTLVELRSSVGSGDLPHTRFVEEMDDTPPKVLLKMAAQSLVVTFGSTDYGRAPATSERVTANYVVLPAVPVTERDYSALQTAAAYPDLTVENTQLLEREHPGDDPVKIAAVVPGYFAAKRRMVSPGDHEAVVKGATTINLHDARHEDGLCVAQYPVRSAVDGERVLDSDGMPVTAAPGAATTGTLANVPVSEPMIAVKIGGTALNAANRQNSASDVDTDGEWHLGGRTLTVFSAAGGAVTATYAWASYSLGAKTRNPMSFELETKLPPADDALNPGSDELEGRPGGERRDIYGNPTAGGEWVPYPLRWIEPTSAKSRTYSKGDRRKHNNLLYECLTPHTSTDTDKKEPGTPGAVPALSSGAREEIYWIDVLDDEWLGPTITDRTTCEDPEKGFKGQNGLRGKWRNLVVENSCVRWMSYLTTLADGRISHGRWMLREEESLLQELEGHHVAGEELRFAPGVPVSVNVDALLTALPGAELGALESAVESALRKQCFILGGSFDPGQLIRDINTDDNIINTILRLPRPDQQPTRLSWMGFFRPGIIKVQRLGADEPDPLDDSQAFSVAATPADTADLPIVFEDPQIVQIWRLSVYGDSATIDLGQYFAADEYNQSSFEIDEVVGTGVSAVLDETTLTATAASTDDTSVDVVVSAQPLNPVLGRSTTTFRFRIVVSVSASYGYSVGSMGAVS